MERKGIMPLWTTAIIGFILLVLGAYVAVSFFAVPLLFWTGIVLVIIGLAMIFIAAVLS